MSDLPSEHAGGGTEVADVGHARTDEHLVDLRAPATSDSILASSGSFGQATIGSFDVGEVDVDHRGVLGVGIACEQLAVGDPVFHGLDAAAQGRASW